MARDTYSDPALDAAVLWASPFVAALADLTLFAADTTVARPLRQHATAFVRWLAIGFVALAAYAALSGGLSAGEPVRLMIWILMRTVALAALVAAARAVALLLLEALFKRISRGKVFYALLGGFIAFGSLALAIYLLVYPELVTPFPEPPDEEFSLMPGTLTQGLREGVADLAIMAGLMATLSAFAAATQSRALMRSSDVSVS